MDIPPGAVSLISTDQTLLAPGCILSFMCNSGVLGDWHHHSEGDNGKGEEREDHLLHLDSVPFKGGDLGTAVSSG